MRPETACEGCWLDAADAALQEGHRDEHPEEQQQVQQQQVQQQQMQQQHPLCSYVDSPATLRSALGCRHLRVKAFQRVLQTGSCSTAQGPVTFASIVAGRNVVSLLKELEGEAGRPSYLLETTRERSLLYGLLNPVVLLAFYKFVEEHVIKQLTAMKFAKTFLGSAYGNKPLIVAEYVYFLHTMATFAYSKPCFSKAKVLYFTRRLIKQFGIVLSQFNVAPETLGVPQLLRSIKADNTQWRHRPHLRSSVESSDMASEMLHFEARTTKLMQQEQHQKKLAQYADGPTAAGAAAAGATPDSSADRQQPLTWDAVLPALLVGMNRSYRTARLSFLLTASDWLMKLLLPLWDDFRGGSLPQLLRDVYHPRFSVRTAILEKIYRLQNQAAALQAAIAEASEAAAAAAVSLGTAGGLPPGIVGAHNGMGLPALNESGEALQQQPRQREQPWRRTSSDEGMLDGSLVDGGLTDAGGGPEFQVLGTHVLQKRTAFRLGLMSLLEEGEREMGDGNVGGVAIDTESPCYALTVAMMRGMELSNTMNAGLMNLVHRDGNKLDLGFLLDEPLLLHVRRFQYNCAPLLPPTLSASFEDIAPDAFECAREVAGISDQDYRRSLCSTDFSFMEFHSNSKSGQFFFFSHDGKFLIKTVSKAEVAQILRFLPAYIDHILTTPLSLLTRIFGIHRVELYYSEVQSPPTESPGPSARRKQLVPPSCEGSPLTSQGPAGAAPSGGERPNSRGGGAASPEVPPLGDLLSSPPPQGFATPKASSDWRQNCTGTPAGRGGETYSQAPSSRNRAPISEGPLPSVSSRNFLASGRATGGKTWRFKQRRSAQQQAAVLLVAGASMQDQASVPVSRKQSALLVGTGQGSLAVPSPAVRIASRGPHRGPPLQETSALKTPDDSPRAFSLFKNGPKHHHSRQPNNRGSPPCHKAPPKKRLLAALNRNYKHTTSENSMGQPAARTSSSQDAQTTLITSAYFIAMGTAFDPSLGLNEAYDIKGSTVSRVARDSDTVKKDVDFLETGRRLRMREDEASLLLAAHERDCQFLAELGVFDYSLLIGIHQCLQKNVEGSDDVPAQSRGPLRDYTMKIHHSFEVPWVPEKSLSQGTVPSGSPEETEQFIRRRGSSKEQQPQEQQQQDYLTTAEAAGASPSSWNSSGGPAVAAAAAKTDLQQMGSSESEFNDPSNLVRLAEKAPITASSRPAFEEEKETQQPSSQAADSCAARQTARAFQGAPSPAMAFQEMPSGSPPATPGGAVSAIPCAVDDASNGVNANAPSRSSSSSYGMSHRIRFVSRGGTTAAPGPPDTPRTKLTDVSGRRSSQAGRLSEEGSEGGKGHYFLYGRSIALSRIRSQTTSTPYLGRPSLEGGFGLKVMSFDRKEIFFFGIIDFLSPYNAGRYFHTIYKRIKSTASCQFGEISPMPPFYYCRRQIAFVKKHVVQATAEEPERDAHSEKAQQ